MIMVIPVMLGVFTVVFILIRIVPGDPMMALLEDGIVSREILDSLRREYGLDQPIYVQYFDALSRLVRLDLGTSFHTGEPVAVMVKNALPYSLQLTCTAMVLAVVGGLIAGITSAIKHNKWQDSIAMVLATVGVAAPDFWLGLLLVYVFVLSLGWLPITEVGLGWRGLILPAVTLAVRPMASIARLARASCLEVLEEDYVRTARGKGLGERAVLLRHVLRNSLIPVVTIIGIDLAATLSNAIVVETVFARPGLGRLVAVSVVHKDFPATQSLVMLISLGYVLANVFVDSMYLILDPRIGSKTNVKFGG